MIDSADGSGSNRWIRGCRGSTRSRRQSQFFTGHACYAIHMKSRRRTNYAVCHAVHCSTLFLFVVHCITRNRRQVQVITFVNNLGLAILHKLQCPKALKSPVDLPCLQTHVWLRRRLRTSNAPQAHSGPPVSHDLFSCKSCAMSPLR